MAMPSSQRIRSETEMVLERPLMPVDLFNAAIKGDSDVLIRRLGLQSETEFQVIIEASHSASEQIKTEHQTVQSELQSVTRFGDTVLHLLVTKKHNELALKVFRSDMSLLKERNKMLETPMHCAAKVGNEKVIHDLIRINPAVVKDALEKTNGSGDTALYMAAKNDHVDVCRQLMKLDPEAAYKVNNNMFSPLYVAINYDRTMIVQTMLEIDPTLACTQFSNGLYPVHEAARTGKKTLLMHFLKVYPDYLELLDPRGRNIFHFAAEGNHTDLFTGASTDPIVEEMTRRMNDASDYEGHKPLAIAKFNGHGSTFTQSYLHDLPETTEVIHNETNFVVEPPSEDKWEKTQLVGLGSVLITTIAFAAAFTFPGGYNQDNGTPVLGRRYMFRAFILANAFAFIQGFLSVFALVTETLTGQPDRAIPLATTSFVFAASSMVVAFGLGSYVTLAPVCLPIAILILVSTLFLGSPLAIPFLEMGQHYHRTLRGLYSPTTIGGLLFVLYAVLFVIIFCLALV